MEGVTAENKYPENKTNGNMKDWKNRSRMREKAPENKYPELKTNGNIKEWEVRSRVKGKTEENKLANKTTNDINKRMSWKENDRSDCGK